MNWGLMLCVVCICQQAHVDQELLIYEAFPYDQQQAQSNLKVRFKKVQTDTKHSPQDVYSSDVWVMVSGGCVFFLSDAS